jgi:hypothetical protein
MVAAEGQPPPSASSGQIADHPRRLVGEPLWALPENPRQNQGRIQGLLTTLPGGLTGL